MAAAKGALIGSGSTIPDAPALGAAPGLSLIHI